MRVTGSIQGLISGVMVLLVVGITGCGSSNGTPHLSYRNPVYKGDFPDPYILRAGATYYAWATNANNHNIQQIESQDLVHWQPAKDAMPVVATWVSADVWAPVVFQRPDGKYVMYYSARTVKDGRECLGRALSASPSGPYRDTSTVPFLCQTPLGGDIDPTVLKDSDGRIYLYWKNDGNCCGINTYIYAQQLSPDGMALVGKRTRLAYDDQSWEDVVVEGPTMWKQAGKYYLFYSANHYDSLNYAVGYSTCSGPLGPCKDARENPIFSTKCRAGGPGGETIIADKTGQTWIAYHAWPADKVGYELGGPGRQLWLDRLDWHNGKPAVVGPTCKPQPAPVTS